jgi:Cd2+/Zn2+-exporting ATPase
LLKKFKESLTAGHGSSILIKEDKPVALFTFIHDDIRVGAKELITNLYDSEVNVEILSGDHQGAVDIFAGTLGVDSRVAHGDMTPEDKVRWVGGRSKTHITMMVGDGFNDAAAMAAADVGVAIGSGESTNLDAADLLIPGDDPRLLGEMIELSRKTRRILFQNLFLSVSVTIILVVSVLMGINENLVIGVLIHELSVLLVIFNGARLAGDEGIGKLLKETVKDLFKETIEAFSKLFEKMSVKN